MAEKEIIEQLPDEMTAKIRRISITTSKIVQEMFAGRYHSAFKGRGMEFDSLREYQPGDEIRSIDWNVTARTGRLQIKKFIEERELSVMLLLDTSFSCRFGSDAKLKSDLAAEICSVLAFSSIYNGDKVGLFLFTDKVEKIIPPRKGTNHVLRVIREALAYESKGVKTDMHAPIDYLNKIMYQKAVCFIISDFLIQDYQDPLIAAKQRHDIIAIRVIDPREVSIPNAGLVTLDDAENGEQIIVDTSSAAVRARYRAQALNRLKLQDEFFSSNGIDNVDVYTDSSYIDSLIGFFKKRALRQHRGF